MRQPNRQDDDEKLDASNNDETERLDEIIVFDQCVQTGDCPDVVCLIQIDGLPAPSIQLSFLLLVRVNRVPVILISFRNRFLALAPTVA